MDAGADPRVPAPVHAALIFIQITFASWHVFGKYTLDYLDPLVLADLRVLGAVPIFFTAAMLIDRTLPAKRDLPLLALLGLLGVFANQLLFIEGLARTTATNSGILMASMPIFTAATAALFGIERVRGIRLAGVILAVAGAMVMLDPARFETNPGTTIGNLMLLANCFCYSLYVVLQRNIVRRMRPIAVTAWAFLFGGAAIVAVTTPTLLAADLSRVPASVWVAVGYIILIPTALNYALISWSIRWSSPALVATYTTLQPVAAALMAAAFLGESAGIRELLGFVLIVAGLFAVSRAPKSVET